MPWFRRLIILPLIYLLIFRGICSGEAEDDGSKEAADTWRYLWLVPAVFYIIWMQHFYASGRSTLENSLDPVGTVYLLLIDAGSVLIYPNHRSAGAHPGEKPAAHGGKPRPEPPGGAVRHPAQAHG